MFPPVVALVHEMRIAQAAVDPAMQQVVDIMPAQQQAHPLGERPGGLGVERRGGRSTRGTGVPAGDTSRDALDSPSSTYSSTAWPRIFCPSTTKPLMLSPELAHLRRAVVDLRDRAIECGARFGRLPRVFKNQPVPFVHEEHLLREALDNSTRGGPAGRIRPARPKAHRSRPDAASTAPAAGRAQALRQLGRQPDDQVRPLRQRAHRRQQAQSALAVRIRSGQQLASSSPSPPRVRQRATGGSACAWPQAAPQPAG